MKNQICDLLRVRYPVIQGAMTNASNADLVSAVSQAGGLGIYAPGIEDIDLTYVRSQIQAIRKATSQPFGVNIMLASPYAAQIVSLVCEEKVPVVTTGAGNPAKYMDQLKNAGVVVASVVPSAEAAVKMEAAGVDLLIAEGMESGGFIGRISTLTLVPQVVDAVKVPVVAAGGIADGRGMAAAFMLGAQGVQMGTRFLASVECPIPAWCKEALIQAPSKDAIVLGERIGVPARLRALKTAATTALQASEGQEGATAAAFQKDLAEAIRSPYEKGLEGTLIGTGQSVGLVRQLSSVADIIQNIIAEYNQISKTEL